MALIKSISGIRGTIGGEPGTNLTPPDVVKFTAAYGSWLLNASGGKKIRVVVGRDARISGPVVSSLVTPVLQSLGIDVIDLGLSTTPTVEVAVTGENAQGGIIITASHNPKQWNALKLLGPAGEFINASEGAEVLRIAEEGRFLFCDINQLGSYTRNDTWMKKHIDKILELPLVKKDLILKKNFRVVVDAVNSSGGIFVPALLKQLGVDDVILINCEPDGQFAHNPEPLPEHLRDISQAVLKHHAHLGLVVDPDVDRLAIVSEDGEMFGEEYTLVAVADYILKHTPGNTVSNLSSTRALQDITEKAGGKYAASAVGEVNVVEMMKKTNAVIGGEGNGGVIYPDIHYGRDALAGIALFLSALAEFGKTCSLLKSKFPAYYISKNKIELTPDINVDEVLLQIERKYKKQPINKIDGLRIEFDKEWVHLRKSNTEPIIRIYAESDSHATADFLAEKIMHDISDIVRHKDV